MVVPELELCIADSDLARRIRFRMSRSAYDGIFFYYADSTSTIGCCLSYVQ